MTRLGATRTPLGGAPPRPPRPRVLVVGPGHRTPGGMWTVLSTLLSSPLADGFEMRHVTTQRDGPLPGKLAVAATGLSRVAATLALGRTDLVWAHAALNGSFWRKAIVVHLARAAGVPCILHMHGSHFDRFARAQPGPARAVIRSALGAATLVIALAPTWERRLREIAPCRTVTIMNPVALPVAVAPWEARRPAVVCLGQLGERKGSVVAVRALALAAETHPEVRLTLAGDGDPAPAREEARRRGVEERLDLPGWLGRDAAMRLLDESSVFALPSQDEGLPVAMLEAMAHGLPVVVTPVGGIPDVVREGVHGHLVPPDDPVALAKAIVGLLDDPTLAERLGTAGREEVATRCALPLIAKQLEDAFRVCLEGASARSVQALRPGVVRAGRAVAARMGLLPIQAVLRDLRRRGVDVGSLRALDVFGYTGERMTRFYADEVGSLDVWEIDPELEPVLRRNLPRATVTITDSYEEMRRTSGTWDLVVVDNPMWPREHFDLFPALFRVLSDRAVVVLRVLPEATPFTGRRYPGIMDAEHLRHRSDFYRTTTPERIPMADVVGRYRELAASEGLCLTWHRVVPTTELDGLRPRRTSFPLLLLGLERG